MCVCQDLLLFGSEGARRRRRITIITDFIHPPLESSASRAIQHPIGRGWVLWRPPGTGKLDGRPPRQRRSGTHGGAVCSGDHDGSWRVRVRVRVKLTTPPPPPNKKNTRRKLWALVGAREERALGGTLEPWTLGAFWRRGHLGRSGGVDTWVRSGGAETWGRSGGADMWDALDAEKQEKAPLTLVGVSCSVRICYYSGAKEQ